MATILCIAGHGRNQDGSFDPGASGYVSKGENRYYVEDFFPAMRKHMVKGSNIVLFDSYNVYDRGNLTSLARSYGSDTIVVECHFDATGTPAAEGGHVIIHADYEPDNIDLKIRDVIKKHIGVRYSHKGHSGISGRNVLKNCNIARRNGINYRLIELGFGTSPKDAKIMINNVDAIARDMVLALDGKVKEIAKPKPVVKPQVSNKGYKFRGQGHVEGKGWVPMNGNTIGTTGEKRRLEAFNLTVEKDGKSIPVFGEVHLQGLGDVSIHTNLLGTAGEKRRLEAVKLDIHDDIEYRVHMSLSGWSKWTANHEWAGSKGKERRIEAIEFRVK